MITQFCLQCIAKNIHTHTHIHYNTHKSARRRNNIKQRRKKKYLMLLPVRCFTCGKVFWNSHLAKFQKLAVNYILQPNQTNSFVDSHWNEIGIRRRCCRAVLLTYVDIKTLA